MDSIILRLLKEAFILNAAKRLSKSVKMEPQRHGGTAKHSVTLRDTPSGCVAVVQLFSCHNQVN